MTTPLMAGDSRFSPIETAVAQIAAGRAVIVVDDADRENEGDIVFAAEMATPELVGVHGPLHLRGGVRPADR